MNCSFIVVIVLETFTLKVQNIVSFSSKYKVIFEHAKLPNFLDYDI